MQQDVLSVVRNVARLMSLQNSGLLDTPPEEVFDRFTRLAAHLLRARTALLSLVDADRQFFKSVKGPLDERWASKRETPLSYSICKHVVEAGTGLVIPDGRVHPMVRDSPAVHESCIAYAGMPVYSNDGHILGTLCVMDNRPREWTAAELDALRDLAGCLTEEIALRTRLRAAEAAYRDSEARLRNLSGGSGR
jgi:GAF domain-containing protein